MIKAGRKPSWFIRITNSKGATKVWDAKDKQFKEFCDPIHKHEAVYELRQLPDSIKKKCCIVSRRISKTVHPDGTFTLNEVFKNALDSRVNKVLLPNNNEQV